MTIFICLFEVHIYDHIYFTLKAVDFVDKLLRYDHQERLTAKEAMVKFTALKHFILSFLSCTNLRSCNSPPLPLPLLGLNT